MKKKALRVTDPRSVPEVRCAFSRMADVDTIKPNPRNPNQHPPEQLALYEKVIRHQGIRRAIVVSKLSGFVVTGHGLLAVLKTMGVKQAPIDEQKFKSAADETAHMLADNRLPELAELNETDLKLLLTELGEQKFDLELAGFNDAALAGLDLLPPVTPLDAEPQMDKAAELQKQWKTKLGQLWELGEHRLLCGDCRKPEDIKRLLGEEVPQFVYSDAPYGISIVNVKGKVSTGLPVGPALRRREVGGDKAFGKVGTIDRGMKAKPIIASNFYAKVIGDDDGKTARESYKFISELYPKAVQIWWGANHFSDVFPSSTCWIVWDKDNGASFFADAELAYCSDKSAVRIFKHPWNGLIKESERGEKRSHPTQKPVALAVWCLENYGKAADVVLDPFSGSASGLMACENTKRRCFACEISPGYVAVALQRFQDATGKTPKLLPS